MSDHKTQEAWAAWTDAMRLWFAQPANLNPFPGSIAQPSAVSEWMKLIDPQALQRRIDDLKIIEAWLRMSLSGIETTIKTLEMQRDAYASINKTTQAAHSAAQTAAQSMADVAARSASAAQAAMGAADKPKARKAARRTNR